jgi:hypothetical protein
MRTILFKAKRLDNGEWVEGSLLETKGICQISVFEHELHKKESEGGWDIFDFNTFVTVDPETVSQFVLTDAYGEKVFENDICRDINDPERIFKVVYQDFSFSVSVEGYRDLFELYERDRIERIGNIFDNPELLNP